MVLSREFRHAVGHIFDDVKIVLIDMESWDVEVIKLKASQDKMAKGREQRRSSLSNRVKCPKVEP